MSAPSNGPFSAVTPRLPQAHGLNAEFYSQAAGGTLHLQQCVECGHFQHPPRYLCRTCSADRLVWVPVTGEGVLYSWTTTHFPFDRGWAPAMPYATGVIELPQAVRLVASCPDAVLPAVGLPVRVVPHMVRDGAVLLVLEPIDRTGATSWD